MTPQLWKRINSRSCVCVFVGGGVFCVISRVLNDSCSKCNWVALPEIRAGLTLKLSFILGGLGPGRGVDECKTARSALSKGHTDVKHC